jgi:hypothetical protein
MSQAVITRATNRASWRPSRPIVAGVLVAAFVLAAALFGALQPAPIVSTTMPTSPDIEAKWGVRPTQVAMTADGGLVDFRFIVLDSDKASSLMSDSSTLPVLRTENTGVLINSAASMAAERHTFDTGKTYFILYRNAGGAIQPGTPVTIFFGDLKIEHVIAR